MRFAEGSLLFDAQALDMDRSFQNLLASQPLKPIIFTEEGEEACKQNSTEPGRCAPLEVL